jgi:hypothetical protein
MSWSRDEAARRLVIVYTCDLDADEAWILTVEDATAATNFRA